MAPHNEALSTICQTIITNIEAPKLTGASTQNFVEFKRKRELYEKQVQKRNKEPNNQVVPFSLRASIDDADLRIFIAAGWITAQTIDSITEQQLMDCVSKRCERDENGEDLYLITEATRKVSIEMRIVESEDRIWSLHRNDLIALENAGYGHLP